METKARSAFADRIPTLIFLVLLAASLLFLYQGSRSLQQRRLLVKEREELLSQISADRRQLDEQNEELKRLQQEHEMYADLEKGIRECRDAYFKLAAQLETDIMNGNSGWKIAYLTFDDGPYYRTNAFLDVLDDYDVPATFFCLMKNKETGYAREEEDYDAIYRRIIESGHTLGNHTATHKLGRTGVYSSVDRFIKEIKKNRSFIEERYGYCSDIMRFPGGSTTSAKIVSIKPKLFEMGYAYVDWNSATGDGGATVLSPKQYRDNVLNNTDDRKILVVLMHDYSPNTLIALPEIIEGLSDQGYLFLPLFHDSVMCVKE